MAPKAGPELKPEELLELSYEHPIVFFDGVCGLCNGVVDWLIRRDPQGHYRFSPLQGNAAKAVLPESDILTLNSIVLLKDGGLLRKSSAALGILGVNGGWLSALAIILRLIPTPLRDAAYDFIARRRYGWFGQSESCRLPTPEERSRFLE